MGDLTEPGRLPLWSDYPRFVLRHRVAIGTFMALGLLVGLAWSLVQPTTYSSTASVALAPVPKYVVATGVGLAPPEVTIDTDAQLLNSPEVLKVVAGALGSDAVVAREHLSVTASPNTHVLHVTVTASAPQVAAKAADGAAAALVQVRREALGALRLDQLRLMRLWVGGQEDLLAKEQSRRLVIPAYDDFFAQVVELRSGLQELEEARLAPAEVLNPALPASRHDYPNTEVPLTSGAMVGLLAGCLLGAGQDRRRRLGHSSPNPSPRPRPSRSLTRATTRPKDDHHAF